MPTRRSEAWSTPIGPHRSNNATGNRATAAPPATSCTTSTSRPCARACATIGWRGISARPRWPRPPKASRPSSRTRVMCVSWWGPIWIPRMPWSSSITGTTCVSPRPCWRTWPTGKAGPSPSRTVWRCWRGCSRRVVWRSAWPCAAIARPAPPSLTVRASTAMSTRNGPSSRMPRAIG